MGTGAGDTEGYVKSGRFPKQAQGHEKDQKTRLGKKEALPHVPLLVVPDFVRQNCYYRPVVQAIDERIEKHDASGTADACEIGVAVAAPSGSIHLKNAPHFKAEPFGQSFNFGSKGLVFQGFEAV